MKKLRKIFLFALALVISVVSGSCGDSSTVTISRTYQRIDFDDVPEKYEAGVTGTGICIEGYLRSDPSFTSPDQYALFKTRERNDLPGIISLINLSPVDLPVPLEELWERKVLVCAKSIDGFIGPGEKGTGHDAWYAYIRKIDVFQVVEGK